TRQCWKPAARTTPLVRGGPALRGMAAPLCTPEGYPVRSESCQRIASSRVVSPLKPTRGIEPLLPAYKAGALPITQRGLGSEQVGTCSSNGSVVKVHPTKLVGVETE